MTSWSQQVGPGRRRAANWLGLAAAPAFAAMSVLALLPGDSHEVAASVHGPSPFGGMAPMYALMAVFHLPPWLRRPPA